MKLPKLSLGLYSRFLILFAFTTIILAFCIALGFFTITEQSAKEFVLERHDKLSEMLSTIADNPIDIETLKEHGRKNRVTLFVKRGEQTWATSDNAPKFSELQKVGEKIESLYFAKYQSKYYLYIYTNETWVGVTASVANFIIYSNWLVAWPWVLAFAVIVVSYLLLMRLLRPVKEAIASAKTISQGNFDYQIKHHSKTELAELTKALNKMATDLKQLFDAKNELLLAVSHELRTPMARMKISLAMAEDNPLYDDISLDVKQMDNIVEQLLEGERLQLGTKVLHLSPYFLPSLIEDVLNEQGIKDKVELTTEIPEEAVTIDVGRIKFLLRNLLQNAINHGGDNNKVQLSVTLQQSNFVITVDDCGPGIPEELLSKIFEPFFQVESISHRSTKGTGLGLYLCQKIALAHNGELTVKNNADIGCQFSFVLPIESIN